MESSFQNLSIASATAESTDAASVSDEEAVALKLKSLNEELEQLSNKAGRDQLPRLVAISKTKPLELLQAAYNAGQRHFGENYVQELVEKAPEMPDDVQWHFVGSLQSNKCKLLAGIKNLYMVETIGSEKLASAMNRAWDAAGHAAPLGVLVQINTSAEESKSGVEPSEALDLCRYIVDSCPQLTLRGLMTIGRPDTSPRPEAFQVLLDCREQVAKGLERPVADLELSMGMSDDWRAAVEMGSTNIRLGSSIFGARAYPARTPA